MKIVKSSLNPATPTFNYLLIAYYSWQVYASALNFRQSYASLSSKNIKIAQWNNQHLPSLRWQSYPSSGGKVILPVTKMTVFVNKVRSRSLSTVANLNIGSFLTILSLLSFLLK